MAQEGRKVKPIPATTPSRFTNRKTSRSKLTNLKPAEDYFFFPPFPLNSFFLSVLLSFSIPFSFHPLPSLLLLPAFFYCFILIFVKIPSSYLSSNFFYSFFFPFPFYSLSPTFPSPSFFPLLSPFPTGETIKPGALKILELDSGRPIKVNSRPVS